MGLPRTIPPSAGSARNDMSGNAIVIAMTWPATQLCHRGPNGEIIGLFAVICRDGNTMRSIRVADVGPSLDVERIVV